MKPLVVISKENAASQNIKSQLLGLAAFEEEKVGFWRADSFNMAEYSGSIVEIVPTHPAEYYVFASTHKSASNTPCLTAHTPGNWGAAELGGNANTLNFAFASKLKVAAQKLKELSDSSLGWQVSVEVDHHGPSLKKPVLFVEIGSGEEQWRNAEAGKIAAQAILSALQSRITFQTYIGFGGTHYAPKFTPMVLGAGRAMGHMISGYALERDSLDEVRVLQAMEKNVEKVECALIDWKGIKGETKDRLIETLDGLGIKWEKA